MVSQLLAVLMVPVLFRHYSPTEFGGWAAIQAIVSIAAVIAILRLDISIVREPDAEVVEEIFWCSLSLALISAAIFGLATVTAVYQLHVASLTAVAAVVWFASAVFIQPLQAWLLRLGRFRENSLILVATNFGTIISQLGFSYTHLEDGLILGSMCGQLSGVTLGYFLCKNSVPRVRIPNVTGVLASNYKNVVYSVPYSLLSVARERAPTVLLSLIASPLYVGLYSQASRLVSIPIGFTSGVFRPVIFHRVATSGFAQSRTLIHGLIGTILLLGAPWVGVVVSSHSTIVEFLLGKEWRAAGPLIAALAVPSLLFTASNWLDRLFDVAGRQELNFLSELCTSIASIVTFGVVFQSTNDLILATLAQSAILSFCYASVIALAFSVAKYTHSRLPVVFMLTALLVTAVAFASLETEFFGARHSIAAGVLMSITLNAAVVARYWKPLLTTLSSQTLNAPEATNERH